MTWTDYELDSALERDLLRRALPLLPTHADGSSRATVDLAADKVNVALAVHEVLGATPSSCIELLGIRPLLVGAAWKVLDLLMETALEEAGFAPDRPRGWSIARKTTHAAAGDGHPAAMGSTSWSALTRTYAETVELRHSLVHRRAYTDANGALVGTAMTGAPLRPLSGTEQEALVRSTLQASELVIIGPPPDERVEADLLRQLGLLAGVHGYATPSVTLSDSLPEITVIVDPAPGLGHEYALDVPALLKRQPFQTATHADLIVQFRDRPGQDLRGRLEMAPSALVTIDPDRPPSWLH